jgi:hypothetical protein
LPAFAGDLALKLGAHSGKPARAPALALALAPVATTTASAFLSQHH